MKIVLFRPTPKSLFYFRIVASNGRTIAQSEGYINRADCLKTIKSLKWKMPFAEIVEAD